MIQKGSNHSPLFARTITVATFLFCGATLVAVAQACIGRAKSSEASTACPLDPALIEWRRSQQQFLDRPARWIDEPHRRVAIPIAQALHITASRAGRFTFPSTAPAAAPSTALAASGALPPGLSPAAVTAGRKVYQTVGCAACHPIDGTNTINGVPAPGPSFKDLFGSMVPLESGQTVLADAAYIRESIRLPQAKIHKGYTAVQMPNFGAAVTDKDIANVTAFLKANSKHYPAPGGK